MPVVGDTQPVFKRLLRRDGAAITNLDDADSIAWFGRPPSGGAAIEKACTVSDVATGEVTLAAFVAADLSEAGWWDEEVVITWTAGNDEHPKQPGRFYVRAEFEGAEG